jgi:hypothetical protein
MISIEVKYAGACPERLQEILFRSDPFVYTPYPGNPEESLFPVQ